MHKMKRFYFLTFGSVYMNYQLYLGYSYRYEDQILSALFSNLLRQLRIVLGSISQTFATQEIPYCQIISTACLLCFQLRPLFLFEFEDQLPQIYLDLDLDLDYCLLVLCSQDSSSLFLIAFDNQKIDAFISLIYYLWIFNDPLISYLNYFIYFINALTIAWLDDDDPLLYEDPFWLQLPASPIIENGESCNLTEFHDKLPTKALLKLLLSYVYLLPPTYLYNNLFLKQLQRLIYVSYLTKIRLLDSSLEVFVFTSWSKLAAMQTMLHN